MVADNGVGISPKELECIRKGLQGAQSMEGYQVGLGNVNLRTKLVFGDEYGLSVFSKPGEGTQVVLWMGCKKGLE